MAIFGGRLDNGRCLTHSRSNWLNDQDDGSEEFVGIEALTDQSIGETDEAPETTPPGKVQ